MVNVTYEVIDGNVTYYEQGESGRSEITHEEFVRVQKELADNIYDKVCARAKQNGCIYIEWIQKHFIPNYYGAAHIIDRMREEGFCEAYDRALGAFRIVQ